jgi:hypothetical protein
MTKMPWKLFKNESEIVFPEGSRRFVNVNVTQIGSGGGVERDIYGNAVYMGNPAFRLHTVDISCTGQTAAPISQIWVGDQVVLWSPDEISVAGPSANLDHDAVPGTCYGVDANDVIVGFADPVDKAVTISGAVSIRYRPILNCVVVNKNANGQQGKANAGWSLTLEEMAGGEEIVGSIDYIQATGGQIVDYTDDDGVAWRAHIFTASGEFVVTTGGEADVEGIGGGGGGGDGYSGTGGGVAGGGGGAGQYYRNQKQKIEAGTWPIAIGAGGVFRTNGTETSFLGITCLGGGRGARAGTIPSGYGGGGFSFYQFTYSPGGTFPCSTPWHRSGNRGGLGRVSSNTLLAGGGGGVCGCGGDGFAGWPNDVYRYDTSLIPGIPYRAAGDGIYTDIAGVAEYIGGGGGGGSSWTQELQGGLGGGGNGAIGTGRGHDATSYGSGGGGSWNNASAGTGSDGRVVIRYKRKS